MRRLVLIVLLCAPTSVRAAPHDEPRPDAHAPIGMMGDHMHKQGEWMLSYRYAFMEMDGMIEHSSDRSKSDVLADFLVTPTKMHMMMQMLGVMYGLTDDVTLTAMLPYLRLDMDHQNRAGVKFTTSSDGLGDIKLTGLFRLHESDRQHAHVGLGVSLPTGSITRRDDTPLGRVRLPYPMQLGSGTFDLLPSLTWTTVRGDWSGGAQASAVLRVYQNRQDYQLGSRYALTSWLARRLADAVSASLRLDFQAWQNIHGADDEIAQTNPVGIPIVPTADPDRQAGRRLDVGIGLNVILRRFLPGHRFAVEYLFPVYDYRDGPALETDWRVIAGWQKAF